MFTFTIFALGAEDCEVNINIILNIVCIYPACLHKLFARNRNIFFYVLHTYQQTVRLPYWWTQSAQARVTWVMAWCKPWSGLNWGSFGHFWSYILYESYELISCYLFLHITYLCNKQSNLFGCSGLIWKLDEL